MPAKHRHAPPLPARFLDFLAALPAVAWLEDVDGNILARNRDPARDDAPSATPPATTTYPLPTLDGSARPLRLVAQVSDADQNGCHARMVSALLSLLFDAERPCGLRLTPRERDIHREFSHGHSYKTISANLGITHETVRWHIARIRQKLGPKFIPILRQKNSGRSQPKPT